jgi:hypothetical protein
VAPPGNQAVNGEHKLHAYSTEDLSLLDKYSNSPSSWRLRLLPSSGLRLVFRPTHTDTHRHYRRYRLRGRGDQELLLRNEYLVIENRILRHQITGRVRLTDAERKTLAEIGQKLGKQALKEVAHVVKPDTILGWHKKLVEEMRCTLYCDF